MSYLPLALRGEVSAAGLVGTPGRPLPVFTETTRISRNVTAAAGHPTSDRRPETDDIIQKYKDAPSMCVQRGRGQLLRA